VARRVVREGIAVRIVAARRGIVDLHAQDRLGMARPAVREGIAVQDVADLRAADRFAAARRGAGRMESRRAEQGGRRSKIIVDAGRLRRTAPQENE
jgi:hypothetical protein